MTEKSIYFINPNLVVQKGDFLGSGIPYMPHIMAYTIGALEKKYPTKVIDSFGENPFKITRHGDFYWQGVNINKTVSLIDNPKAIFIYASSITNTDFNLKLIKKIRKKFAKIKIIVLANTQAVTSFDVTFISKRFFKVGTNIIVYNNIENTVVKLIKSNFKIVDIKNIQYFQKNKIITTPMTSQIGETKKLILPAWEEFPLKNYWKLGYSHGPTEDKYLPLLTSYGCPFHCEFCINPSINKSRWQAKSAKNVFQEIKHLVEKFNVYEFHTEDLNPTVDKNRIKDLCELIIKNKIKVKIKIVSGTKVETIDENMLSLMKQAGFEYISISPESGSPNILTKMKKPFNYQHADRIIKKCHQLNIKTQACFVLGFPEEAEADIVKTKEYVKHITKLGIDEIAIFIATPLPGTSLYNKIKGYKKLSSLTFSPKWRGNYQYLEKTRTMLYRTFIIHKLIYQPINLMFQMASLLSRKFKTKMEMIPFRIMRFRLLLARNHA